MHADDTNMSPVDNTNNAASEVDEMAEFDKAMSEGVEVPDLMVGQLVTATVIDIKKEYVLLDIGDKAEGIVEIREFQNLKGEIEVAVNDQVQVVLTGRDNSNGQLRMSRRMAKNASERERIKKALDSKEPVSGRVKKATKDGLIVDIGLDSFMHRSQIDIARIPEETPLDEWVGKDVTVFVTSVATDERDSKRSKISVSRRKFMESEAEKQAAEVLSTIEPDIIVTAKVKKIEKFGVFVDLGGIDGLVPASEIAWERNVKVDEVLKIGYSYKFKVLSVEQKEDSKGRKQNRISLSRKQIKPDPWLMIAETYPMDAAVKATVTGIAYNCAYLTLEDGTEAMIPREELSWGTSLKRVEDVLKKGDETECKVIGYNDAKRHVKLSLRAVTSDPWADIEERYPVNSKQNGKVLEVVDYGAFVELDEYTKGLVYISDFTYDIHDKRKPAEILKVGDTVEVVVLKIEKDQRRINLGIKQVEGDPFRRYCNEHKKGATVTGTVKEVVDQGVRVQLADNVIGFLRIKDWDVERTETLKGVINSGDSITAMIINIDSKKRDISLSRRELLRAEEKKEREAYTSQQSSTNVGTNLGDLFQKLKMDK